MVEPEMFQSLQHILARRPPRTSSMGPVLCMGPVGVTLLAEQAGRLEPRRAFSTYRRSRRAFALGAPSVAALQLREHRGLLAFHGPHQPPSCRACEHTCGLSAPGSRRACCGCVQRGSRGGCLVRVLVRVLVPVC